MNFNSIWDAILCASTFFSNYVLAFLTPMFALTFFKSVNQNELGLQNSETFFNFLKISFGIVGTLYIIITSVVCFLRFKTNLGY